MVLNLPEASAWLLSVNLNDMNDNKSQEWLALVSRLLFLLFISLSCYLGRPRPRAPRINRTVCCKK